MDPNANLAAQERILTEYANTCGPVPDATRRLRELREALVDWLDRGGFQPDWRAYPQAAKYWRYAPHDTSRRELRETLARRAH